MKLTSREDATDESTCQVANLGLSQGSQPSSQARLPPPPPVCQGIQRSALWGVGPMQQAVIHLASEISPASRGDPTLLEVVPIRTNVPATPVATDMGTFLETQGPDDSSSLVRPLSALPLDLPSSNILLCADQHPVGGYLALFQQARQDATSDQ